jgi:hypothetical protein
VCDSDGATLVRLTQDEIFCVSYLTQRGQKERLSPVTVREGLDKPSPKTIALF